jgi:SlyX protein
MDGTLMEQRLENIESKLMSAEDQLDELNRTVWRQQQELDLLREHLRQLAQQVKSAQPGGLSRPEDEIPPHW